MWFRKAHAVGQHQVSAPIRSCAPAHGWWDGSRWQPSQAHPARRAGRAAQVHAAAKLLMRHRQERCGTACKLAIISATGFRAAFGRSQPAWRDHKEAARFPCGPRHQQAASPAQSVSPTLRRAARSRVRLNGRAPVFQQAASSTRPSLNQRALETTPDCASGRSSLRAATHRALTRAGHHAGMISSHSLTAFSGVPATAPAQRPGPVRPVRDAGLPAQAAQRPLEAKPQVVPPGNTPRGSLVNLQV